MRKVGKDTARVVPADPIPNQLLPPPNGEHTHLLLPPKEANLAPHAHVQLLHPTFRPALDSPFIMASQAQLPQFDAASKVSEKRATKSQS
jgi:hypothetical protein